MWDDMVKKPDQQGGCSLFVLLIRVVEEGSQTFEIVLPISHVKYEVVSSLLEFFRRQRVFPLFSLSVK